MQLGEQDNPVEGLLVGRAGLVRGLLVIVTAVAVGAFVLAQGLDDPGSEAIAADATSTSAGQSTTTSPGPDVSLTAPSVAAPTDSTDVGATDGDGVGVAAGPAGGEAPAGDEVAAGDDPAAPPAGPGDITVLVLNGAGAKGVAGRGVAILSDVGYDTLAPKNATVLGPSQVLFAEGAEQSAREVAAIFEVSDAGIVKALDPASPPINDTQDADVIVVIGQDDLIDL